MLPSARTSTETYGSRARFQLCRYQDDAEIFQLRAFATRTRFISARPQQTGDPILG